LILCTNFFGHFPVQDALSHRKTRRHNNTDATIHKEKHSQIPEVQ
jgi:hypothetical protein